MNDIHGYSIFDDRNYKTRVLGGDFPAFTRNDAFFKKVTDDTKAFTKSIIQEIASRHTIYDGGHKIMSEIPLPPEVKLRPIAVGNKVVDWVLTNQKKGIAVSQALLGHTFGPTFQLHIDQRNFVNKDGSIVIAPVIMVTGNARSFYKTAERFANYLNGNTEPQNPTAPRPQMQYDLSHCFPKKASKPDLLLPMRQKQARANTSGGYKQINAR
jgi:hypothetical protein